MPLNVMSLFTLYRYTPGRRAWMLTRIAEAATRLGLADLAAAATALLPEEQGLAAEMRTWTTVRAGNAALELNQELVAGDQARDALLGHFARFLEALAGGSGRAAGKAAARLLTAVFPEGSRAIITLPYPDESAAIEALLAELGDKHAADVAAANVGDWVDDLRTTNDKFVANYDRLSAARAVDYKELKVRDDANQAAFLRLVAKVVGAADDAQLGALLDSVAVQQAAMKSLYQSRRAVPDIDADTGVPLPEPGSSDPATPNPLG